MVVIAGRDKGKRGHVLRVLPDKGRVVVENINMVKRHTKGNPMQGSAGGILEKELAVHVSNVAIWNPMSQKPDRIGVRHLEDGRKVRYFKSNDEVVDL